MKKVTFFIVLLAGVLGTAIFVIAESNKIKDKYKFHVEKIHSYESFKKTFSNVKTPSNIISKSNYDIYIEIRTEEYKKNFSIEELRIIANFFSSEIGKKFFFNYLESKTYMKFISKISTSKKASIWTCKEHAFVKMKKKGECPVCFEILIIKDEK